MVLSNKEWLDKMDEIISAIKNGGGDSQVIEDMLSNMWISSATYNVGDYVLYNNNIWKCLVQNSNITPSEGTTWTRVNITSEISTLNSNLSEIPKIQYKEISATTDSNGYVELDVFALSARVLTSAIPGNYTCLIHGYKTTAQNNSNALVVKSAYNMANIVNTNMTFGILYMC